MMDSCATKHTSRIAGMMMALSLLTACIAPVDTTEAMRTAAEVYIREHVSELSPRLAVLGGTWYVTDIAWQADGSAVVTYEDGHISLSGVTSIQKRGDAITAERFTHIMIDGEPVEASFSNE